MKRITLGFVPLLVMLLVFAGCQTQEAKTGIAPYPLEEGQKELLSLLGLEDTTGLFSYQCPQDTIAIKASTYVLKDGAWASTGEGSIYWDPGDQEAESGVFVVTYQEDGSFAMSLHGKGVSSFQSDPVAPPEESLGRSHTWLSDSTDIVLHEEIPVALFVTDVDGQGRSYSPEDYFTPEVFDAADTVQAVTIQFSQEE